MDVKMDLHLVLVLQVAYETVSPDVEVFLNAIDTHIVEAHALVIAYETGLQLQGFLKVLQHGSEGARDVLQDGGTGDERRLVSQPAPLLLAGQLQGSLVELQRGLGQTDGHPLEVCHLLVSLDVGLQLTQVDARHGVGSVEIVDVGYDAVLGNVGHLDGHVGCQVEVADIEESAFRLFDVLSRLIVVGDIPQPVDGQHAIVLHVEDVDGTDVHLGIDGSPL